MMPLFFQKDLFQHSLIITGELGKKPQTPSLRIHYGNTMTASVE